MPLNAQVFGFGLQLKGFHHTRLKRTLRRRADAPLANGVTPAPFYGTTRG